ncbi:glycerol-3-phosphate acyltransferase 1, mitochondrial [Gastrophryne carolinensis]
MVIWRKTRQEFMVFVDYINSLFPTIVFNPEISEDYVTFLDVAIEKDKEGHLTTGLFSKPTDRNTLLRYESAHPRRLVDSLPISQFLRVLRINSDPVKREQQIGDMYGKFQIRGYPKHVLNKTLGKAREIFLGPRKKDSEKRKDGGIFFPQTFNNASPAIERIVRRHHNILCADPGVCPALKRPFRKLYYKNQNLRDMLVKADPQEKYSRPPILMSSKRGTFRCNNCNICNSLILGAELAHPHSGQMIKLGGPFNCLTEYCVYLLKCPCGLAYVGKTVGPFKKRFQQHRSDIRININRHLKGESIDYEKPGGPAVLRSSTLKWKETLLSRKRPFVGRCCYVCNPQSRDKLFNPSIPTLGLRNVIYINETHTRHRGWLARRLCYVLFVQERDVNKSMFCSNMAETVLKQSSVMKAIEAVALESSSTGTPNPKTTNKVKRKAKKILQEMVASISPTLIRLTGWVLLKLFNGFFLNIQIHKGQLEMMQKAATETMAPLVFLPVHKSHIDYLLLTFVLFCHNIKAPHIASGNNLNIPIFSTLIRLSGGFFIRRKLDETPDGKKDILYRALLHEYIEQLLCKHQFLEIFLEGTRSRSGKTSCGRAGLLSVIVDTLCNSSIPDVLIVPVGISYDRIIEGHYNGEQLGKPKKDESLWSVARGVLRMLRKNYGCVRIDFAQPFSLKEYLENQRQKPLPAPLHLDQALLPAVLSSRATDAVMETVIISNADLRVDGPVRRQIISNLANHVLFTADQCCAVMSTHIVACLLLYRYREGVSLSVLVEDFFSMKEEVLARDFDLGFSGSCEDVVMHAIHLLGNSVIITHSQCGKEFFIAPNTKIPAVFELNFYSNGVLHVYITEAIVACALNVELKQRRSDEMLGVSEETVSQERLLRTAAVLCYLLSNEGMIALPCQMFYQVCHEAVHRLITYGILTVAEEDQEDGSPQLTDPTWGNKMPDRVQWRSDEEDEDSDFGEEQRDRYLKVSPSQEHKEFIAFLQRLLGPILEAYSSSVSFICGFNGPVPERELTQSLQKYLIARTERKVAVYSESATLCLAKNAVKTFVDLGVFQVSKDNGNNLLEFSHTFLPQSNRHKLLEFIISFMVL